MRLSRAEAEGLVRSGAAALQRGDSNAARIALDRLVSANMVNPQILLLYALACRGTGDSDAEEAAVDRLLKDQPNGLRALIMKGDCRARKGDHGGADSFYRRAVAMGAQGGTLPPDLDLELRRVGAWLDQAQHRYRQHLEQSLGGAGMGAGARSRRFQQSLDIMFGEKQVFLQQPGVYYFPELAQRQFFEREEFGWVEALEAATDEIRAELLTVMKEDRASFRPYLVSTNDRPQGAYHGLVDNPDWSSFYLWNEGGPVEEHVGRCPRTFEAIRQLPLPYVSTRAPVVMFSWLKAGARIPPHNGSINTRLIGHLPLIVPAGCGFRVGNETRAWEVGKTLIFDDTIEHEAWNDSDEDRVVLIFDIWRPELTEEERRGVASMFEAVDSFQTSG